MKGWIKLHRKMKEWEWYDDIIIRGVFIDCLLSANHESREWQGIKIPAGSFITSLDKLAKNNNITIQKLRTILRKINKEITTKSTNKYTMITVVKYYDYQDRESEINKQITNNPTNEQQTNNKPITTNKNDKNNKNDKKIISKDITEETSDPPKNFEKKEITKKIDSLILSIKNELSKYCYVYDNEKERMFARHIFVAKEFGSVAESLGYSREDFALQVVKNSMKMEFRSGKIIGPKNIYQKYPKVLNDWKKQKPGGNKQQQKEVTKEEYLKMQEARNNAAKEVKENERFKQVSGRFGSVFGDIEENKQEKSRFNPN